MTAGAALAAQYTGKDDVAVCFFGDGASNQGTVHESMNLSKLWSLPVVFAVENNGFSQMSCQATQTCVGDIADRAAGYHMPAVLVDGNDVIEVYDAIVEAVKRARAGEGPSLVECKTYRYEGHFMGDPQVYREKSDVEEWKKPEKDPISRFAKRLIEEEVFTAKEAEEIKQNMVDEINQAVEFAKAGEDPELSELYTDVYAD